MTKHFKSSHRTIKRVLNTDLNKIFYQKITVQSLKEVEKHLYQWITKNINSSKLERMIEKLFVKNGYFNRKNDVI